MTQAKVLMLGPDLDDLGGISRVVKTWRDNGFFQAHDVVYLPTTSAKRGWKSVVALLRALSKYLCYLARYRCVVYVHTSSHLGFYRKAVFLSAGALLGAKLLLHVHPSHFRDFLDGLRGARRRAISLLLGRVNGFAVLTRSMAEFLRERYPQKPVYVLPNPINVEEHRCPQAPSRRDRGILYLGWYVKAKGVYDLVDAVELLARRGEEVEADFYGTKEIERLQEYVRAKGLDDRIRVHGWIEREEKLAALHSHTLLVLPSYSEGMPNVILEAMAAEIPIVSTPVGGIKEVLTDGVNALIVRPGDAQDLGEKIARLLQDAGLRKSLAQQAYQDVKSLYDAEVIRDQFFNALSDFISRARRSP